MCQKPETPMYSEPCGRAIMWGTKVCAEHAYKKAVAPPPIKLQALDTEEEALAVSEDGTVYNADYEAVGRYDRITQSLIRFHKIYILSTPWCLIFIFEDVPLSI